MGLRWESNSAPDPDLVRCSDCWTERLALARFRDRLVFSSLSHSVTNRVMGCARVGEIMGDFAKMNGESKAGVEPLEDTCIWESDPRSIRIVSKGVEQAARK